jgi:hypothetical protein
MSQRSDLCVDEDESSSGGGNREFALSLTLSGSRLFPVDGQTVSTTKTLEQIGSSPSILPRGSSPLTVIREERKGRLGAGI